MGRWWCWVLLVREVPASRSPKLVEQRQLLPSEDPVGRCVPRGADSSFSFRVLWHGTSMPLCHPDHPDFTLPKSLSSLNPYSNSLRTGVPSQHSQGRALPTRMQRRVPQVLQRNTRRGGGFPSFRSGESHWVFCLGILRFLGSRCFGYVLTLCRGSPRRCRTWRGRNYRWPNRPAADDASTPPPF